MANWRDLLAGLGPTVGQVVSCYVRTRVASAADWTYFLVPFGTTLTPVPVPVFFTGAAAGTSTSGPHGVITATIDPVATAGGSVALTVVIDLNGAPSLAGPELEFVACTEQGILPHPPDPAKLDVAIIATGGPTTNQLARKITLVVSLPPTDDRATVASITATVDVRAGQSATSMRYFIVDGPVTKHDALSGAGLPIYVNVAGVYTVDSEGPLTGTRGVLVAHPKQAGGQIVASARLTTPWTPPTRPAVNATAPSSAGSPVRYAVAGVRADGSETPVSARSQVVRPAAGQAVQLTLPPQPTHGQLTGWRVYRSRLLAGDWGPDVAVGGTRAFGASVNDPTPQQPEAGLTRAQPASLTVEWGQPAPVAPVPFPLDITVDTVDADLDVVAPPAQPVSTAAVQATLPATLRLDVTPGRAPTDPTTVVLVAGTNIPVTALDIARPRTRLAVHATSPAIPTQVTASVNTEFGVGAGGHVAWSASGVTHLDGNATLPTEAGLVEIPFVHADVPPQLTVGVLTAPQRTRAGAISNGGQVGGTARVRLPDPSAPRLIDVGVDQLAANVGLDVTLVPDQQVDVAWAQWGNAPAAGTAPSAAPTIDPAATADPTGNLRLRAQAAPPPGSDLTTTPPLLQPLAGRIAAVALDRGAGTPLRLDANVDGLRNLRVHQATTATDGGTDLTIDAAVTVDQPVPVRIQFHDDDAPLTVQARARRFGPFLGAHVGRTAFGSTSTTLDAASDPVEGLRLWAASGGTSTVVAELASVGGDAAVHIDPAGPGTAAARPVRADLDTGRTPADTTTAHVYLANGGPDASPATVDVVAGVPGSVRLVAGASAGTLAADSTPTRLVDADGGFDEQWVGRTVEWATGRATITDVVDRTTVDVSPGGGQPGPDLADPKQNWYRLVDDPAGPASNGARVRAGAGPLRARVGIEVMPGWGLLGATAVSQLRTDQPDDTQVPSPVPLGAVTARVAGLDAIDFSTWIDVGAGNPLDPLEPPPPDEVVSVTDPPRWTAVTAAFASGARSNPGLAVVLHDTVGWSAIGPVTIDNPVPGQGRAPDNAGQRDRAAFGRNAFKLRLAAIPDQVTLRTFPGLVQLDASGPSGPGFVQTETAQWLRGAPLGEAGYSSLVINSVPRSLAINAGWKAPDMGGGVDTGDHKSFGALSHIASFRLDASRIVVSGDPLDLGRFRTIAWDTFKEGHTPWESGGRAKWALSDIWFASVEPSGDDAAEWLVHRPGEPQIDGDAAIEMAITGGRVMARIFKVALGDRQVDNRRAGIEASTWPTNLETEIQLYLVKGKFAVNMHDYTKAGPPWGQEDDTDGLVWWMVAYDKIPVLGTSAQFGSNSGTPSHRDSAWAPYWA